MIHSYKSLIQTADVYADSRTLITGVEMDVFSHIGSKSLTAKAVAKKFDGKILLRAFSDF